MITGWKTFLSALLVAVFGALEVFDFTQFLTDQNSGYAAMGIAVVMMVLRKLTKTPVFKSE